MSGWPPDRTGWHASMDGNADMLIGAAMPPAMIVTEKTPRDMFSRGATKSDDREIAWGEDPMETLQRGVMLEP